LLLLNPVYWFMRLAAGAWAGARGKGEAAKFQGMRGKLRILGALLKGTAGGIVLAPRTIRKRRSTRHLRRLTPKQIKQLLFQYRIPLKKLSEEAS
jgi:hypothetical protein